MTKQGKTTGFFAVLICYAVLSFLLVACTVDHCFTCDEGDIPYLFGTKSESSTAGEKSRSLK